jgi:hypothetical protein
VRFLTTFLATAVALIVVLFAVSNRGVVVVEIWPFPLRIEAGLYAVILVAVAIGFLAGLVATWLNGSTQRKELRASRKRLREMELSLGQMKDALTAARAKAELSQTPRP